MIVYQIMPAIITSNKTIAKNAVFLYARMLISMAIGFYTSRIVLQALGVQDYGIYNLVGGIVAIINILNSSLRSSTSRFISYSIGNSTEYHPQSVFSTAIFIHLGICLLFLLFAETIGLWFVNTQLVIETTRIHAANVVYQSVVITTLLTIIQVPFSALITSHERYDVFAYLELSNNFFKLIVAILLFYFLYDRLIIYAILNTAVSIIIILGYIVYSFYNYHVEVNLSFHIDKGLFFSIFNVTKWTFVNIGSYTLMTQGNNIIINRFFGTIMNASVGVAMQLHGIIMAFVGNVSTAFYPQIVKNYASKNYQRVHNLIFMGTKLSAIFMLVLIIPLILKMNYIINLWLVEVPTGTVQLTNIIIVTYFFNNLGLIAYSGINASGNVKTMNLLCCFIYLFQILIAYIVVRFTHSYLAMYISTAFAPISTSIVYIYLLHKSMPYFSISSFFKKVYFPLIAVAVFSFSTSAFINSYLSESIYSLILLFLYSSITILVSSWLLVINNKEKKACIYLIKLHLHKNKNNK